MPIIQIQMLKGRTVDQKRALVREITAAFTDSCGGDASEVNIVILDVDSGSWGTGGELCSEMPKQAPKAT